MNPGVPVFSSDIYAGLASHWGEEWARPDTTELLKEVQFLMDNKKSFNFYVIHGGTNFGYTAGASSGGKGYEPDVTSYDYDAPIDEQGRPGAKYYALRNLIGSYLPKGRSFLRFPSEYPHMKFHRSVLMCFHLSGTIFLRPVSSVQPKPFEAYGQDYGFILYSTELIDNKMGKLTVTDLHDYATVFLNGEFIGTSTGERELTLLISLRARLTARFLKFWWREWDVLILHSILSTAKV